MIADREQIGINEFQDLVDALELGLTPSSRDIGEAILHKYSLRTEKAHNWGGACFLVFETSQGGTSYLYYDASVRSNVVEWNEGIESRDRCEDSDTGSSSKIEEKINEDIRCLFQKYSSRYKDAYRPRPTSGLRKMLLPEYDLLYETVKRDKSSEELQTAFLNELISRRTRAVQPHDRRFNWRIPLPTGLALPDMTLELLLIYSEKQVRKSLRGDE